jgi:alpha-galactosidase
VVTPGAGACRVQVDAVDDAGQLRLELVLELLPSGLLRTRAAVQNLAPDPYQLDDLVLSLPVPDEATNCWTSRPAQPGTGAATRPVRGRRPCPREPQGRTGADSAYVLHAGTAGFGFGSGAVWAVHTAWSGNHTHYADACSPASSGSAAVSCCCPARCGWPPASRTESPWIYGSYGNGLDDVARRFPPAPARPRTRVSTQRPVTLNVWEAVYFDHDADKLIELGRTRRRRRRRALRAGRRLVRLPARTTGPGSADWVVSPDVWPRGLHPLVDRVRELGMQFGLWFEPEMVNPDSDLARSHPDWIMAARAEWPLESRYQQVLNLGIPEAYEHVKSQIMALLKEYPIDYIKWDHNRDLVEAGSQPGGGRPGVHAQTLAVYRLIDELRAAHPGWRSNRAPPAAPGSTSPSLNVRTGSGSPTTSTRTTASTCCAGPRSWCPPEYLGSHIASGRSHTTGRRHDLASGPRPRSSGTSASSGT